MTPRRIHTPQLTATTFAYRVRCTAISGGGRCPVRFDHRATMAQLPAELARAMAGAGWEAELRPEGLLILCPRHVDRGAARD